jgi:hypothetical protein
MVKAVVGLRWKMQRRGRRVRRQPEVHKAKCRTLQKEGGELEPGKAGEGKRGGESEEEHAQARL